MLNPVENANGVERTPFNGRNVEDPDRQNVKGKGLNPRALFPGGKGGAALSPKGGKVSPMGGKLSPKGGKLSPKGGNQLAIGEVPFVAPPGGNGERKPLATLLTLDGGQRVEISGGKPTPRGGGNKGIIPSD